tara:strand:- start:484 stop:1026 length:543 start_codon:yes stop_codon:yes gene_type:complete
MPHSLYAVACCPQFEMNSILTFIFLIFISICSYGQDEKHISDYIKMTETDSLYLTAIKKYTYEIEKFYHANAENDEPKIIYIQHKDYLRFLPNSINGYKIQKLGIANRKKHFRANKNKLVLLEISPLTIENGRFEISLIPYFAELKSRKRLNLSLSDWTIVYFKYIDGKLIYDETENGGI